MLSTLTQCPSETTNPIRLVIHKYSFKATGMVHFSRDVEKFRVSYFLFTLTLSYRQSAACLLVLLRTKFKIYDSDKKNFCHGTYECSFTEFPSTVQIID